MSRLDATSGARLLVDALVAAGVGDVVMAPGSRSTPLVAACARDPRLRLRVVHDERSGAFLALGIARARSAPAVLLTTSGTAVANASPAVVEADADGVPIVILSADRPPEATDTDANQTIDQRFFFGARARAFVDVPPPEDIVDPESVVRAVVDAVTRAVRAPRGPAHINARFRKPLEPVSHPAPRAVAARPLRAPRLLPDDDTVAFLRALLRDARSVAVVAGAASDDDEVAGVVALARALGAPVLACVTSGLRDPLVDRERDLVVLGAAGALVRAGRSLPDVDVVVRTGGAVVDDVVGELCARARTVVRVDACGRRRLERAAAHGVVVPCDPRTVAAALPDARVAVPAAWQALRADDERARAALLSREDATLDEPGAAQAVVDAARRTGTRLFIGNSMPLRCVDRFCPTSPRVLANRGGSGIDGLLSTAAGIATAGPTFALLGDLSFLHDAGALSALSRAPLPLRVVVVDNGGGGIFDHLPIARHDDLCTPYFFTPHDVDLVALCAAYGVPAARVDHADALRAHLARPLDRIDVVIATCPRSDNVAGHTRALDRVRRALERP